MNKAAIYLKYEKVKKFDKLSSFDSYYRVYLVNDKGYIIAMNIYQFIAADITVETV